MAYRIALGISGACRFINSPLESQILSLGHTLSSNDSIDIFVSVWSDSDSDNATRQYIENAVKNTTNLVKCTVKLVSIEFLTDFQPRCQLFTKEGARSENLYSMFYALNRNILCIRSQEIKLLSLYDVVIRSRPDVSFLNPLDLSNVISHVIENQCVITQPYPKVPWNVPMMNDQFFIGPSQLMCDLLQIYSSSAAPFPEYLVSSESFLRWRADTLGIILSYFKNFVTILQRPGYTKDAKKGFHLYHKHLSIVGSD